MPFWKSAAVPAAAPAVPAPAAPPSTDDADALLRVLDAVGHCLQAYAHDVFDMPGHPAETSAALLRAWQRHVVTGAPRPGDASGGGAPVGGRDWAGLAQVFRAHRRREHDYVVGAIGDLRDALWATVETVHRTATLESSADAETTAHLARAREAITRVRTDPRVTDEVLDAVARIEAVARARQQATREQYGVLARTLDAVGQQLEEARRESTTDALTGLGNRKHFDVSLARARHLATLDRRPVTLLLIDADGLKAINDGHGHQAGDAALTGIARALARTFLRQGDTLCRIGGDEFAVLLAGTDAATAHRLAHRFCDALAGDPHATADAPPALAASCGVAELGATEPVEAWFARADRALYAAKRDALRCVVVAD